MKIKNDSKFEVELTCFLRNLTNFGLSTQKNSQKSALQGSPFEETKYITFELKSTQELCFMTLKSDAKFKEKLT